jgi:glycosyltransferase involved in cell wall biosynthesis
MNSQTVKPDKWVVVDNSSTPANDWSAIQDRPDVVYERVYEPKPIGWMRNRTLEKALELGAKYIVFWDDDDYYPPTRVEVSVRALKENPTADIAGSSLMYMMVVPENMMLTTGPFHANHATAATMTVRRSYAERHRFDEEKQRGEEKSFTKDWSATVVQLPAEDTIVVIGHRQNTVDKSDVAQHPSKYNAKVINDINGKMAFRVRWPVEWGLFCKTFSV